MTLLQMGGKAVRGAFGRILVTTTDDADRTTTDDADRQIFNETLVLYAQGCARRSERDRAAAARRHAKH